MNSLFRLKRTPAAVLYLGGALLCVTAGVGMPFLCIGLGYLVGWYTARRELLHGDELPRMLRRATRTAVVTSFCTFVLVAVVWGPQVGPALGAQANPRGAGLPAILHGAQEGLIIWVLGLLVVSPLLQLMATVFAAEVTVLRCLARYRRAARRAKMSELTLYRLSRLGARKAA